MAAGSTWVVGDLQGCDRELAELLERVAFDPATDQLWCVGDLVNRGPDSLAVLRRVQALGAAARVVLGNHDLHLLGRVAGVRRAGRKDTLDAVLSAPDRDALVDWLRSRPLLHLDADARVLMVHAGIPAAWAPQVARQRAAEVEAVLQAQDWQARLGALFGNSPDHWDDSLRGAARHRAIVNHLTRMRAVRRDGRLLLDYTGGVDDLPAGSAPWWQRRHPDARGWTLLFGHWAALGAQPAQPDLQALDGGCVWGQRLVAVRLADGQRVEVPASRA